MTTSLVNSEGWAADYELLIDRAAAVKADSGLGVGLSLGYRFNGPWQIDLEWQSHRRDTETGGVDTRVFVSGDYSANVFQVSPKYYFSNSGDWQSFVGAGLVLLQDVALDVDLSEGTRSFANSGKTGIAVYGGFERSFSESWTLGFELRKISVGRIDLEPESGDGRLLGLDYKPTLIGVRLSKEF